MAQADPIKIPIHVAAEVVGIPPIEREIDDAWRAYLPEWYVPDGYHQVRRVWFEAGFRAARVFTVTGAMARVTQ